MILPRTPFKVDINNPIGNLGIIISFQDLPGADVRSGEHERSQSLR